MEMLKSKSIIALTVMVLGVSYLSAINNVNAIQHAPNNQEIISKRA